MLRSTVLRVVSLAAWLGGCAPLEPPPALSGAPAPSVGAASALATPTTPTMPTMPVGTVAVDEIAGFGVFAAVPRDVFPDAVTLTLDDLGGPPGAPHPGAGVPYVWSYGTQQRLEGPIVHYLTVRGPSSDPTETLKTTALPDPALQPGERLVYFVERDAFNSDARWPPWRYSSVAIGERALVGIADVASCTNGHVQGGQANLGTGAATAGAISSLHIEWTRAGNAKLAALPQRAPLVVVFGNQAMSMAWQAESVADFPFAEPDPSPRVQAFVDLCTRALARAHAAAVR